ncbi:MAG: NFACT RNA binding domain-containing protein [Candidatus Diapherotrites archaeon]
MRIILDLSKGAQQNAQHYFDESKKFRAKAKGVDIGLALVQSKLEALQKQVEKEKVLPPAKKRSKEWFEKFRWCFTRNGFLVIGGRDAHSNEAVVKHHLEEKDAYFHADIPGAPHCVLKLGDKVPSDGDLDDAAAFAGLFSSVWKKGFFSVRVYQVSKSQVSKKAPSGESLGRGAFMIYGERKWFDPRLMMGIGIQPVKDGFRVMCGPLNCVKTHAQHVVEILPGSHSKSDVGKSYSKFLLSRKIPISIFLDDVVASLPTGEFGMKIPS